MLWGFQWFGARNWVSLWCPKHCLLSSAVFKLWCCHSTQNSYWGMEVGWEKNLSIGCKSVCLSVFLLFSGFICVHLAVLQLILWPRRTFNSQPQPSECWEHRSEWSPVAKSWGFCCCLFFSTRDPNQIVTEAISNHLALCLRVSVAFCFSVFVFPVSKSTFLSFSFFPSCYTGN